jgi:hypothetical protein
MNLAVRLPRMRRPVAASILIGLLFTLMMLTKTTAVFLLPALGWALLFPLRQKPRLALLCALGALSASAVTYSLWMGLVARLGLLGDYKYLFFVNTYVKPTTFYWPLLSLWWSWHGGLWIDHALIPLAGLVVVFALLVSRTSWGRLLLLDPVFGASILAVAGYIFFMTYQNHPQPRYFVVVAFFCFILVGQGAEALMNHTHSVQKPLARFPFAPIAGWAVIALALAAAVMNAARTVNYALHPQYTFVNAAEHLADYVETHPNGKRLLLSISGDQIALVTHLPALCDDFGTQELVAKTALYQPGWYAAWNDLDPGTLEDLHNHFSLEQVASFQAFDDPERNQLVLFKLHPLPDGQVRDPGDQNLKDELPDDKFDVPVE